VIFFFSLIAKRVLLLRSKNRGVYNMVIVINICVAVVVVVVVVVVTVVTVDAVDVIIITVL